MKGCHAFDSRDNICFYFRNTEPKFNSNTHENVNLNEETTPSISKETDSLENVFSGLESISSLDSLPDFPDCTNVTFSQPETHVTTEFVFVNGSLAVLWRKIFRKPPDKGAQSPNKIFEQIFARGDLFLQSD